MNKSLTIVIALLIAMTILFLYPPTQLPRAVDTGWTQQGVQEVVTANNKFAFELYSELNKAEQGNIFYSPYSIFAAIAMVYEGAKGQTADEIKSVFHFPENILRPNFAKIYNEINKKSKNYQLRIANALWAQKDYPFLEDYISRVKKYYGGKAANLDFRETEKSRQIINNFIKEQTNKKIKNSIPKGVLTPDTRLVLTNAIYFKGKWKLQFDKSKTHEGVFKITPTNIVRTPMMVMDGRFNYAELEDLQILELPYKGEKISMLILLPRKSLDDIESFLTAEKLNEYKAKMYKAKFDMISIPKFEFSAAYSMKDVLTAMGMPTAFSEHADFSGMTKKEDLFISAGIHKAYIKVDEEGTEAAAATIFGIQPTGAIKKFRFIADHPFIFIIQDNENGNILFMGRIIDPTKKE